MASVDNEHGANSCPNSLISVILCVLVKVIITMTKYHDQKHGPKGWDRIRKVLLGGKGLFSLHILSHSPLRKAKTGTQKGRNPGKAADVEGCSLLACFPWFVHPAFL